MRRLSLIFLLAWTLAACRAPVETTGSPAATEVIARPTETAVPPPLVTVATPSVPPPTATPPAAVAAIDPTEPAPATASPIANPGDMGVLSGRTEEGAFFLGDPGAPITHIDYSDFL